ncbi:MAG: hypothetical protein NC332_02085 [Firmicutes bacterium]|nr:hypothetical protein [Bacillota bacterium]
MNYSKIRLNNERNQHVTKRLNRLNTWNFFKVLYRENIWRLFGFSLLMLLCMAPIVVAIFYGSATNAELERTLPYLNSFGFSTGAWTEMDSFYERTVAHNNLITGLITVGASVLLTVVFSGGLAVIRDAFWTGKLSTVGVFKSIGKGIKANVGYAFVSTVVIAFSAFGLYCFYAWASNAMPVWVAIILLVLLSIVAMLLAIYLLILCSVSVTYKQTVFENLDDSWRLMWLNILPNIIHFLIAVIPLALYFLLQSSMLATFVMVFILMFGGMYVPLVWQTHMMKTFALFHPVEAKKKKQSNTAPAAPQPTAEQTDAQNVKGKKKRVKSEPVEEKSQPESAVSAYDESDEDVYAIPSDDEETVESDESNSDVNE